MSHKCTVLFIGNNLAVLESEELTRLQWLFSSLSSA